MWHLSIHLSDASYQAYLIRTRTFKWPTWKGPLQRIKEIKLNLLKHLQITKLNWNSTLKSFRHISQNVWSITHSLVPVETISALATVATKLELALFQIQYIHKKCSIYIDNISLSIFKHLNLFKTRSRNKLYFLSGFPRPG